MRSALLLFSVFPFFVCFLRPYRHQSCSKLYQTKAEGRLSTLVEEKSSKRVNLQHTVPRSSRRAPCRWRARPAARARSRARCRRRGRRRGAGCCSVGTRPFSLEIGRPAGPRSEQKPRRPRRGARREAPQEAREVGHDFLDGGRDLAVRVESRPELLARLVHGEWRGRRRGHGRRWRRERCVLPERCALQRCDSRSAARRSSALQQQAQQGSRHGVHPRACDPVETSGAPTTTLFNRPGSLYLLAEGRALLSAALGLELLTR